MSEKYLRLEIEGPATLILDLLKTARKEDHTLRFILSSDLRIEDLPKPPSMIIGDPVKP